MANKRIEPPAAGLPLALVRVEARGKPPLTVRSPSISQVFALDTQLDVPAGAERDEVLEAMNGHVLAAGELIGTFQQGKASP